MGHSMIILRKEWMSFTGSDRSVFVVYAILVIGWGLLLASWGGTSGASPSGMTMPLWIALFSVVVAANFANTVFVTERVTGSLEILLTSGVSRNGILFGKLLFVMVMTLAIGCLCIGLSVLLRPFMPEAQTGGSIGLVWSGIIIYAAASFFNASSSAYLSVILPNPRLLHLLTLLMVSGIMSTQMVVSVYFPVPYYAGALVLTVAGVVFCLLAKREFNGERIIRPVIL
jgi:ABC-type Na+ efflux pump permease subunit